MINSIKDFFKSSKPKPLSSSSSSQFQPRVINFGTSSSPLPPSSNSISSANSNFQKSSKIEQKQQQNGPSSTLDPLPDNRYSTIQQLPSLKDLGLKKDQIQQGQLAVLYDTKFVFCKFGEGKYLQIKLIVTNYKICICCGSGSGSGISIGSGVGSAIGSGGMLPGDGIESIFFPLGKIDKLNKYTTNQSVYKMLIYLKDGRKFKFRINSQAVWKKIFDRIQMFAFIKSKRHFFAYRHFQFNQKLQSQQKGWKLYDPLSQFLRMGIKPLEHTEQLLADPTSDFKILDNRDGKVCSTYPPILIVPSRMPYDALLRCARFRSRQRMPALTYAFQYQQGKFSACYRSSQSKVGVQNSRSGDDELMLRHIGFHGKEWKQSGKEGGKQKEEINCKIYDARGFYAAFGNKISGKGYQSEEFYSNCKLEFMNIPNIHAVREAYNKTIDASFGDDSKFFLALAQSKWYEYIFLILYGALDIAKNLVAGMNCLVHCSDGWDRTSQLCSLAALILDPYYRTIQGFQILIQKDWITFGHQFSKRLGQGMNNPLSQQKSQIFLQFLDCVTQIMHQFPSDFQFNYKYIHQIGEQAYSNLYGNFLCNCYVQMVHCGVRDCTVSLWSRFGRDRDMYLNPFYLRRSEPDKTRLLGLDANEKNMRFWKEHFLQFVAGFRDVYGIYSCKFTEDNLHIIHRHLVQEKMLLQQKYQDNVSILKNLDRDIKELARRMDSDQDDQAKDLIVVNNADSKKQEENIVFKQNQDENQHFQNRVDQLEQIQLYSQTKKIKQEQDQLQDQK